MTTLRVNANLSRTGLECQVDGPRGVWAPHSTALATVMFVFTEFAMKHCS
jgi:hypothetical protein